MTKHLILVLSDGSTYELLGGLLPGAKVLVINDEGMQVLTDTDDASFLSKEHIEGEYDIECLLPRPV